MSGYINELVFNLVLLREPFISFLEVVKLTLNLDVLTLDGTLEPPINHEDECHEYCCYYRYQDYAKYGKDSLFIEDREECFILCMCRHYQHGPRLNARKRNRRIGSHQSLPSGC